MDPYLEEPGNWPDVHHGLISEIQAHLNPQVRPKYGVRVAVYLYTSNDSDPGRQVMFPNSITLLDEEIRVAYIEIREMEKNALVTVIEVMSPATKVAGSAGRKAFMSKRRETRDAHANWVEIDMLRAGKPTAMMPLICRATIACLSSNRAIITEPFVGRSLSVTRFH